MVDLIKLLFLHAFCLGSFKSSLCWPSYFKLAGFLHVYRWRILFVSLFALEVNSKVVLGLKKWSVCKVLAGQACLVLSIGAEDPSFHSWDPQHLRKEPGVVEYASNASAGGRKG